MALTAPGQTAAISVFIDPLIGSLHISRDTISAIYLVATLASAAALTPVGRALDHVGIRPVTFGIVVALAGALVGFSHVDGIVTLGLCFAAMRVLGQGALSLSGSQAVAVSFHGRRGSAMGISSAVGNAGVAVSPVVLNLVLIHIGWRRTALVEAAVLLAVLLPATGLGLRHLDRLHVPRRHRPATDLPADGSWTLSETLRSPMFWAMASGLASVAMLATGLSFHQISILGAHGLSRTEAAANFLPQTAATLGVSLTTGPLLDRIAGRYLMAVSMVLLAGALVLATLSAPGWRAVLYAIVLGAAGGGLRAQEATTLPEYYGTGHLGSIRGAITAVSIAASAFGPLALALGRSAFGSYTPILLILVAVPIASALALLTASTPHPHPPAPLAGS